MRTLLAAVVLVAGLGRLAWAEPLDCGQVGSGAKWVVHVDFDALRAAKTAQRVGEVLLRQEEQKQQIEQIRKALGMDPTKDVQSVTFYGSKVKALTGVVLIRAKVDRQRVLGFVKKLPGYDTSAHGDHALHKWTQDQGKRSEHEVTGCFHTDKLIVVGRDPAEVTAALDVLDGKAAGMNNGDPLLADKVPAGTVVQAAAVAAAGLAEEEGPFVSPFLRKSELISLAIGEHEGQVFVRGRVVAESSKVAKQLREVADGLLAMAKFSPPKEAPKEFLKILDGIEVTSKDKTVTVGWKASADVVLEMLEQAWKQQAKPKQGK